MSLDNAKIQAEVDRLKSTLSRRELAKMADILVVHAGIASNNPVRSKAADDYRKRLYGDRAFWRDELATTPENGA